MMICRIRIRDKTQGLFKLAVIESWAKSAPGLTHAGWSGRGSPKIPRWQNPLKSSLDLQHRFPRVTRILLRILAHYLIVLDLFWRFHMHGNLSCWETG